MDNAKIRRVQPATLQALTENNLSWSPEARRKAIIAGVAVVLLILIIVGGISLYQHRSAAAATEFGAAMQVYQTPVANQQQPVPPGMKTFADSKARALAANKQFVQVAEQYGSTGPGKTALYFAGLTYMEAGENGPAESTLKKVAGSWDHPLAALGKMSLAQLYQQTGRNDQAVNLYQELTKENASTVPAGLAQIQLAELYQAEGQTQKARDIYAQLRDKDKNSKGQPGPAAEVAAQKLNPTPQAGPAGAAAAQ